MISGPVVGGMADRQGRKKMCLWFCGIYALSCLLQVRCAACVLYMCAVP